MKKFILATIITLVVLFAAIGSVGSVSVAANTKDAETEYTEVKGRISWPPLLG